MKLEQFVYWLRGYLEISNAKELDAIQLQIIKDHLDLVFTKVTPDRQIEDFKKALREEQKVTGPINHAWPVKLCSQQETYC